jgi:hypothetical protein
VHFVNDIQHKEVVPIQGALQRPAQNTGAVTKLMDTTGADTGSQGIHRILIGPPFGFLRDPDNVRQ